MELSTLTASFAVFIIYANFLRESLRSERKSYQEDRVNDLLVRE